jgi:DNA repair exonuclease SbcCD ATPase subunit|uniref:ODAD1 central coiled coil region domain-containing protein n=1 Tax=Eutreptiella gymnastica TaxID=73025 RepID=A0A7S4CXD5_9EUGL|mmetsp:Transcript_13104/g.23986  ORF Transcript_13104/g.23986 Transcript_13104/m.23986 type:complete len:568 (-) Transcript_13104:1236-2939(-)|eukprot:CAMPEP_0174290202 /NCGR_PEP_ID=MMETSP0809-20121228/27902_1 /TAXON_ID=73025 ORGANISM="Eutreptiella gymnastica-like, Strain CCMP1594" /NCGR_SAMPLE_ID=MMETSP0809 /ASSEMBLY_ACC=CAM_ASM_000658 /LENGTH=567 /DNA_ID=CAMNT_0015388687 /DNA_START=97 /DNA_END=1800 /DNA_ORIENTATION=+
MSATVENGERQEDIQKKMRLLDKNQKAYHGDTATLIKKQNETLQALMKENEALHAELQNSQKLRSVKQNIQHQNSVGQLTENVELLERKVQTEEARVLELTDEIKKCKTSVMDARRSMGGINITKDNSMMVEKQVKVLENRLDQALVKFNDALAHNKELREQIDNLRRERVVFDGIYKKLERELHEKKKQMADIIEQSNLYYEERDMATNELQALKSAAEKDMLQYEDHFRELEIMVEADKQLKESLKQSQKSRPGASAKKDNSVEFNASHEEDKLKKSLNKSTTQAPPPECENIEEIMAQLMEATDIHDTTQLLEKFVTAEEQNFSMYNFVNDLHNEVENLEEGIANLRAEHGKHKGQTGDQGRQKTLKDLEDHLARTERTSEEFEDKTRKSEEAINELRGGIEAIFQKLGCSLDEMNEVLGTTQCTESNVMIFLGIIEQRTTELLAQYNTQQAKQERHRERTLQGLEDEPDEELDETGPRIKFIGQGPNVPFGQSSVHTMVGQLPSTGDNFGNETDDAEDDRVLTQEELRAQTEMRLAAKEEAKALGRDPKKKGKGVRKKTIMYE